jgi:hypothetical protein
MFNHPSVLWFAILFYYDGEIFKEDSSYSNSYDLARSRLVLWLYTCNPILWGLAVGRDVACIISVEQKQQRRLQRLQQLLPVVESMLEGSHITD